jgi:drug/metabolite transporter (DMT)-like permease
MQSTDHSRNLLGLLCIIGGIAVFSLQDLILKLISDRYPLAEAMALRGAVAGVLLTLFTIREGGLKSIVAPGWVGMMGRGWLMLLAYVCYYLALASLPLSTTIALFFCAPLVITVLSVLWLGEKVSLLRWLAVAVGFAAVVYMARPREGLFDLAAGLAILAGVAYATSMVMARQMGARQTATAMAFWGNAVFSFAALAFGAVAGAGQFATSADPTLAFLTRAWVLPTPIDAALMSACGVTAALGLVLLTQGYRVASANVLAPFEYTAMVWGVLWGWVFFADWPDTARWIGIAVIIGAGLFVLWRERVERA